MATTGEADCSLASKCMDFCQALASQGLPFHFTLNMGSTFTFSLDTRGKAKAGPVAKKKSSPSTQRRNARRREEFLSKKRQSLSTVNPPVDKASASLLSCDQCDYKNVSEKGLRQHKRMKHGKPQLDTQLQSSSPSTPEMLRKPTSYSDALAVSPVGDPTRVIPCSNCDEDMSADHICPTHTCGGCDEVLSSEQELTDHQRTVHPNMCHVCFKFFVGENSFLAHFRQEHMNY